MWIIANNKQFWLKSHYNNFSLLTHVKKKLFYFDMYILFFLTSWSHIITMRIKTKQESNDVS